MIVTAGNTTPVTSRLAIPDVSLEAVSQTPCAVNGKRETL
ncbi:unnamed protein product, partial [Protopolystoma xenopodis]